MSCGSAPVRSNPRNSVSWGDGVYKSTNGGKSWTNVGLKDTRHIGRIVIDPRNPNVVYVGALGHLWGPNKERGVFKTTDGGQTWTSSLFINADTGVSDLAIDPFDGNTIYAAAYEVRRDGFAGGDPGKGWGPGSGIYKTTDAGRTWRKLTDGLPSGDLGRIGIDVAASNPSVLYAVVQTPTTVPRESADESAPPPPTGPKTMKDGGVFRSDDRGETWHWVNATNNRPFYYSQVRIDPSNENHLFVMGSTDAESEDGGRTFRNQTWNIHVDHHAMWIDPHNPKHILDGNDGGIDVTWDGGRSWEFLNELALSQMYSVDVDMRTPYFIYGGAQDYCSWGGPSETRKAVGIQVSDWFKVQTGDGFQVRVDPVRLHDRVRRIAERRRRPPRFEERAQYEHQTARAIGTAGVSLQLGDAAADFRARSEDHLHRRQLPVQVVQSRRRLDGDQPGADDGQGGHAVDLR